MATLNFIECALAGRCGHRGGAYAPWCPAHAWAILWTLNLLAGTTAQAEKLTGLSWIFQRPVAVPQGVEDICMEGNPVSTIGNNNNFGQARSG